MNFAGTLQSERGSASTGSRFLLAFALLVLAHVAPGAPVRRVPTHRSVAAP